jgi:hypothetical protein
MEIHDLSGGSPFQSQDDMPGWIEAQFNPSDLEKSLRVNWNELVIPGMSHPRLQYGSTGSTEIRFKLFFNTRAHPVVGSGHGVKGWLANHPTEGSSPKEGEEEWRGGPSPKREANGVKYALDFLDSLCYSKRNPQSIAKAAPPRCLFFWPQLMSLTCVVSELKHKYISFDRGGAPIHVEVDVSLKEIRDIRLTSEDVRANGSIRYSPEDYDKAFIAMREKK